MAKRYYHCQYCDNKWDEDPLSWLSDPRCSKCGSRGEFYVKSKKDADRGDEFGYEVKGGRYGEFTD